MHTTRIEWSNAYVGFVCNSTGDELQALERTELPPRKNEHIHVPTRLMNFFRNMVDHARPDVVNGGYITILNPSHLNTVEPKYECHTI